MIYISEGRHAEDGCQNKRTGCDEVDDPLW